MSMAKVAVTLEEELLERVDRLVTAHVFPSRSRVFQVAVAEKIDRLEGRRLAAECSKLDPREEQSLAEEGMDEEAARWPEY